MKRHMKLFYFPSFESRQRLDETGGTEEKERTRGNYFMTIPIKLILYFEGKQGCCLGSKDTHGFN